MELLGIITGIASLVAGGIGIVQSIKRDREQSKLAQDNLSLNEKVSQQNFDLQKEQFEYQKELNQTVMDREDSAYQRQVADLQKAGLSPLMVSGGASATPLTSATAPQQDISGINEATHNMMSAYNDIFNRKMSRIQLGLQAATNIADMKTKIAESKYKQEQYQLQNDILKLDKKYYESHPERNLGLQQVLLNLASNVLGNNNYPAGNGFGFINDILPGNKNPTLQSGNLDPARMVSPVITKKDIQKDTKKIVQKEKTDYQNALDILSNYSGEDWQNDSLNYIYRHTNAWRDYEYLSDFRNAILNLKTEKARRNFLSKYPYIEHRTLNWD